jgi:hypothetical protein
MNMVQTAVGDYVLVKPEPTPAPKSVISGLDQAASGRVVSIGDAGVELEAGDLVYFDAHRATQVGELLAVDPENIFSRVDEDEPQKAAPEVYGYIQTTPQRAEILSEVNDERKYQDELWGQHNDDGTTEAEWKTYIDQYTHAFHRAEKYKDDFRTRMVKVAALAVAAVEAFDRTNIKVDGAVAA